MASSRAPPASSAMVHASKHGQHDDDGDSDWEYEYSTTETETYYVTLDISKADFITRHQASVPSGRGGYKEQVLGDVFTQTRNADDDMGASDDGEGENEQRQDGSSQPDPYGLDEFQILELHSSHPLISFRGRVYEGQWSRNVGTELLFTQHDEKRPLPVLRHLEDGIDLLAASSARIMLTEKSVKPTNGHPGELVTGGRLDDDESFSGDRNAVVPEPDPGASAERYAQGDFLAKLIALKKRKGETDDVTVVARLNDADKRPSKPKPKRSKRKASEDETAERPARGGGNGRARARARARGRGRARGAARRSRGQRLAGSEDRLTPDVATEDADESQSTPRTWAGDEGVTNVRAKGDDRRDDDGVETEESEDSQASYVDDGSGDEMDVD
ncbi:hypothetical protein JX266_012624 [Neoarthrinium moseri]|nr:hypothetical protein JX266_012624 [Neoarthrinium moseri]